MYIKQIRLKNYRCYKEAEIKFDFDESKNIALATGEIKSGKTVLFNAVGWCLYGKETQLLLGTKIEDKDEKPIPNEKSYKGDRSTVEVEIDIKIPEGNYIESLSIRRGGTFVKGATGPTSTNFTIDAYHAGEKVGLADYKKYLKQFLPEDLIQFYLFDGEYLQHTAQNSNKQIREGLKKLFNIDIIENASEMIGEIVEGWYKQSSKMPKQNSRLNEIDSEIAIFLEKKRAEEIRIEEEGKKKVEFTSKRDALNEELIKEAEYQEALNNFKIFDNQQKALEARLKQEKITNYTDILTKAYLINAKYVLQKVNGIVEKDPRIEGLPANVRQTLMNHLLKRKKCVCGNHISKGSDEEKSIIRELKIFESEGRLDFLLDLTGKIPLMLTSISERENKILDKFDEIKKLETERKLVIKKKDEIHKGLPKGEIDVETYQNKLSKLKAFSDEMVDSTQNINIFKSNLMEFDERIKKLKEERNTLEDKSGEAIIFNNNIKIGEYLQKIFNRFNSEVLNNVASELETEINNLVAKNKKISELNVQITTDDNNIDFKFVEKGSTKHYLTGGQNQLFGMIIMASFVRIMGRRGGDKIPFVFMDNPFSSIDKESLKMVSKTLSDLFKHAQVILFTTNDKFEIVYKASKENISTAMTLINDGTNIKLKMQENGNG